MRWVTSKDESEYMKTRQKQNLASSKNSKAEAWMNEKLKTTDYKWTRQAMWGYRLFDFWNAKLGIAVEVDGPEHVAEYDAARDRYNYLRSGILVLRVKNFDEADADKALKTISSAESWQQRKETLKPGRDLLRANGLKVAKSGREKLERGIRGLLEDLPEKSSKGRCEKSLDADRKNKAPIA